MDFSLANGLDWLKQNWKILVLFHNILHYIVYYARITVIKMQYRVNFLVDGFTILQYVKKCRRLKSVMYDVHTCKHNRMRQNTQCREFQILITCLNANDPTA